MFATLAKVPRDRPFRDPVSLTLFVVAYAGALALGALFSFAPEADVAFWPASGLLLGALIVSRPQDWPFVVVVALAIHVLADILIQGRSLDSALGFALADGAAAIVGAILIGQTSKEPFRLHKVGDLMSLIALGAVVATLLGTSIAVAALLWSGAEGNLFTVWKVWWAADALGVLIVTPLVLALMGHQPDESSRLDTASPLETAAFFVLVAVTLQAVLGIADEAKPLLVHFPYVIFPFLIWGALRFDMRPLTAALLLVAVLVIWNSAQGRGPFIGLPLSPAEQIQALQSFLSVAAVTTLILSAVVLDRGRRQIALRQSEAKFRDLVEISSDWYWEMDADLRFTQFAPDEGKTGLPRAQDALGKTRWELAKADPDRDRHWAAHRADCLAHRPFRGFQYRVRRSDGSFNYRRVSGRPLFDHRGTFTGYRGTVVDVTTEVRARQQARKAEQRLRDAIESLPEGFAFYGPDETLLMANQAFFDIHRLDPLKVPNRIPRSDLVRMIAESGAIPEAVGNEEAFIAQRLEISRDFKVPFELEYADERWMLVSEWPASDGCLVTLQADISKIKQGERELREREQRLSAFVSALDNAGYGLSQLGPDLAVVAVNRTAVRMAGYDHESQIIGHRWIELAARAENQGFLETAAEQRRELARDGLSKKELTWNRLSGAPPLEIEATAVRADDGSVVAIFTDLTERRRAEAKQKLLEQELQQAQKMEALGRLAGGTAHEINNLLQPILSFAKLALDRGESPEVRHDLEQVLDAGRKAKKIVGDVLTFAHKGADELEPLDLNELAAEAVDLVRETTAGNVLVSAKIASGEAMAMINRTEVTQVVLNLVQNALDALPEADGRIAIATESLDVQAPEAETLGLAPGTYHRLVVEDNGCGMSREVQDRILEPFFTTKPVGKGSGLGLPVVYGIVKAWRGRIHVGSEVGEGSVFSIYVPQLDSGATVGEPRAC